jgi:hypothetical protein
MLKLSASLLHRPVVSLRTGQAIAIASDPIINPHNLKILGWWCNMPGNGQMVLLAEDVREDIAQGLAVNDDDALSNPADLVRYQEILDIHFDLMSKVVKTKRQKIGKVHDYSYNEGMFVQKLYVAKSIVKVFTNEDTVIIDRNQILEVTDNYILVKDTEIKVSDEELAGAAIPA